MPFAQLVLGSPGAGKSTYCDGSESHTPPCRLANYLVVLTADLIRSQCINS